MPDTHRYIMLDDEAALEAVLTFLDAPPLEGSTEDRLFGRLLAQVNDAAYAPPEDPSQATIHLSADLQRRLLDLERRRGRTLFGDHPDGLGPTLGMDIGHS